MRVRFAPSPTGELHVGGARTALYNWLLARKSGGVVVLRIEDTDAERSTPESEARLLADLRWLGLGWDEGPDCGGPHAPYRQSERLDRYQAAADELLAAGAAYRSWVTDEELEAARERAEAAGGFYRYSRGDYALTPEEESRRLAAGEQPALRLAVAPGEIVVDDLVRGEVHFPEGMFPDFVLLRSNGRPTYNFACALDDAAMKITHVVRGEEHLANTAKQILVLRALGKPLPAYAHLPLILDRDRSKLSKRSGGATVGELRERGFLAEAVVNMLALQGWHPQGDEERLSRDDLVREFDLARVRKAGGIYDLEKMAAFQTHWMQELARTSPGDLAARLVPFLERQGIARAHERAGPVVGIFAAGGKLLADLAADIAALEAARGVPPLPPELDVARATAVCEHVARQVKDGASLTAGGFKEMAAAAGAAARAKGKRLYQPLRLALTGEPHGPDLGKVAEYLGPELVAARLDAAREAWSER